MSIVRLRRIVLFSVVSVSIIILGLFLGRNKSVSSTIVMPVTNQDRMDVNVGTVAVSRKAAEAVKILFVGDLMFDRYIRQVAERRGRDFVFAGVKKMLAENNLVVGNLEGPITDSPSVSVASAMGEKNNYIFTFPSQTSADLGQNNIRLVNLGNNHILNFGETGLAQTKAYLQASGIDFFGDPSAGKRLATWKKGGVKVVFVSYNQFEFDAVNQTLCDIEAAKQLQDDKIILYTHWGKEYANAPEEKIQALAHQFVDAGADLIIGSHPHVTQGKEEYQGKLIYYSLGNFIFDQYFSPETQKGLAVQIAIDPATKKMTAQEFPVVMNHSGQTLQP
jgi:poly-gamma-glutamate synthesis protein (capsule biosynthesis protein)